MNFITKAEKLMLKKMFPAGCRIELEYMEKETDSNLRQGDLGTVIKMDDMGNLQVSWDKKGSFGVIYKRDKFKCIMTKQQIEELLRALEQNTYGNMDQMQECIEDKVSSAFPEMYFRKPINNELLVELCVNAFLINRARISVKYHYSDKMQIIVDSVKLKGA